MLLVIAPRGFAKKKARKECGPVSDQKELSSRYIGKCEINVMSESALLLKESSPLLVKQGSEGNS